MTFDWFSFLFGAMSLLVVEFLALIIFAISAYTKQQKIKSDVTGAVLSAVNSVQKNK